MPGQIVQSEAFVGVVGLDLFPPPGDHIEGLRDPESRLGPLASLRGPAFEVQGVHCNI